MHCKVRNGQARKGVFPDLPQILANIKLMHHGRPRLGIIRSEAVSPQFLQAVRQTHLRHLRVIKSMIPYLQKAFFPLYLFQLPAIRKGIRSDFLCTSRHVFKLRRAKKRRRSDLFTALWQRNRFYSRISKGMMVDPYKPLRKSNLFQGSTIREGIRPDLRNALRDLDLRELQAKKGIRPDPFRSLRDCQPAICFRLFCRQQRTAVLRKQHVI